MDVIGFLYVSLGSSKIQLHGSIGSRRAWACSEGGFSSQNGNSAWGVYYRRAAFCCAFLWAKGLNTKDIHKEMFPVYGGKCLSRKLGGKRFVDDVEVETKVRKWLRQQSKDFYAAGFKTMGQVYQCWWRTCREINVSFFPGSNITCFTFYIHVCPIYWLSLPRKIEQRISGDWLGSFV
jgi:hypothetical protein